MPTKVNGSSGGSVGSVPLVRNEPEAESVSGRFHTMLPGGRVLPRLPEPNKRRALPEKDRSMSKLIALGSRVTRPVPWHGGGAHVRIACSVQRADGFGPGVEVVLEERAFHAGGHVAEWTRVRNFQEPFEARIAITSGEFRLHVSQDDGVERLWTLEVGRQGEAPLNIEWESADGRAVA